MSGTLRVLPLGGIGEIGKNMTVVEYDGRIVVVDVGLRFPTADMMGIDLVLPDFSYLRERAEDIEAIVVTHGHEDHLGALPWVLRELGEDKVPVVYGGKLTTYRAMAEDVVDRVLGELGMRRSCKTKHVQLQGPLGPARVEALRSSSPLPSDVTDHLIRRHGADAERIVGRAVTKGLELRLVPGLPYIEAEVLEAAEDEMVLHLEDFMERRTHISLEATDHGLGAAGRITFLLGGALGWTAERCREEVASYRERVDARETWRKKGS